MNYAEVVPPSVQSSWWQRNRNGVIAGLVGLACFVGLVFLAVFSMFRGSDAYKGAIAQARGDAEVVRELGEPIEPGWWVTGFINVSGPSGKAAFAIPLRGPSGRGTLYVAAEKQAGRWRYKVLEVAVQGKSDRINLLRDVYGV